MGKHKETFHLLISSSNAKLGLGQAEARDKELCLEPPHGWQGCERSAIICCLSGSNQQEGGLKRSTYNLDQRSNMTCEHSKQQLYLLHHTTTPVPST